jgi:tetratricopeptide (TPR) repeat protein
VLLGALGLLLLGGGGAAGFFFYQRHQEEARRRAVPPPPPPIPAAVQEVLPRWKLRYLEQLSGTSAERLAEGQQQLARDERFAYAEAEESFQQALLLDPNNDAAIAGYVQALALGRGAGMDDATFEEARSLAEAAAGRSGRTAPLLVAHANLLLARSRQPELLEGARTRAEEVLAMAGATDAQKAEAHLVLGRVYLATSLELARNHFDSARKLAPDLKRVAYYLALAHESGGEYKRALDTLRARLKANPKDWDSLAVTSRIYQEVGAPEEARKLYEARAKASPGELRALLPLAVLSYQAEDNAPVAVRELRALLRNRNRYEDRELAEVLVHLAAAERAAGNPDAGAKAAEEALELEKDLPEAHLQLFMVALGRRDAAAARTHLEGLKGRLEDPALQKVLEGRLLLLEKKPAEALERFQEAVRLDERRLDAQLLAGVAAASAKRREDAFRALSVALRSDPLRLEPRPVVTRFWLRPGETVEGVEGTILALAEGQEDPSALLYEGLLRFHQGDLDIAERHFRDVLEVDTTNAGALAYRALIARRKGRDAEARGLAAKAAAAGRQVPVAHLAQGLVLADEARQAEPAKRALRDALALSPKLLSAQVRLAELEAPQRRDSARETLVKAVGLDPAYLPAKRMLYLLDK